MPTLSWLRNPQSVALVPASGDRVTLHADGAYRYLITADVTHVEASMVSARVVSVFDRDLQSQIRGGEVLSLVGSTVRLDAQHVFTLVSRSA